ncbi:MAG: 7-cyano-7-deazaguanine synthase [Betaproteobacteria bacterium]|nr:7-cyano-7-deazaguanine synthase [Betaproteobacteria bacterium]
MPSLSCITCHDVVSLGIEYGQTHHVELDYASAQCAKFGVERRVIRVSRNKPIREIPKNRSLAQIRSGISPAFLPGRNGVFFMLAVAEAADSRQMKFGQESTPSIFLDTQTAPRNLSKAFEACCLTRFQMVRSWLLRFKDFLSQNRANG